MATQQKMFCKVCYDAKKKDYTSHYVRDRVGGKVVCPTLLSQQCKYCKKHGHTPSQCPALEGKYKKPNRHEAQNAKPDLREEARRLCSSPPPPPVPLRERARRLCESPPPPSLSENFPMIGQSDSGKIVRPAPMKLNVWASVVARPQQAQAQAPAAQAQAQAAQAPKKSQAPEPKEVPIVNEEVPIANEEVPIAEAEVPIAVETGYVPESYSGCWADM
jgi:hypothetical protein